MTTRKTDRKASLADHELQRVHGGSSIELENIIISSVKDGDPARVGFKPPLDSGKGS